MNLLDKCADAVRGYRIFVHEHQIERTRRAGRRVQLAKSLFRTCRRIHGNPPGMKNLGKMLLGPSMAGDHEHT